jgi:hypothetical protein
MDFRIHFNHEILVLGLAFIPFLDLIFNPVSKVLAGDCIDYVEDVPESKI